MSHSKSQVNKNFFSLLPIMLLLSGCLGFNNWTWQHPKGYDNKVLQQDTAECETIAAQEINRFDYIYPYPLPFYDRYYYRYDRYRYFPYDYRYNSLREFQDRRRYFRICMKAKGWQRVKLSPPQQQPQ